MSMIPQPARCKSCKSMAIIGVQYQGTEEDYDGVSEWLCSNCGRRIGRWTGKILNEGELEPRYGLPRNG